MFAKQMEKVQVFLRLLWLRLVDKFTNFPQLLQWNGMKREKTKADLFSID